MLHPFNGRLTCVVKGPEKLTEPRATLRAYDVIALLTSITNTASTPAEAMAAAAAAALRLHA